MIIIHENVCGMIPATTVAIGLGNISQQLSCWRIRQLYGMRGCTITECPECVVNFKHT